MKSRINKVTKKQIKSKNKKIGILIVLFSTILITIAQFIFKSGLNDNNYFIIFFGFILYGLSFVLMMLAFQFGELSTLYPLYATSYLWVALVSFFYFNELITFTKLSGIFLIIGGIALISKN